MSFPMLDVESMTQPCNTAAEIRRDVGALNDVEFHYHTTTKLENLKVRGELIQELVKRILAYGVSSDIDVKFLSDVRSKNNVVVNINRKSHPRSYSRYAMIEFEFRGKTIRGVTCISFDRWGVQKNGEWVYFRNFNAALR